MPSLFPGIHIEDLSEGASLDFQIDNPVFKGPFQILLHLIDLQILPLHEVSLSQITRAYLDYLKSLKDMNINLAAEFLLFAAYLLEAKSSLLLPVEKDEPEEEIKEDLINRLSQYKIFKEAAESLAEKKKLFDRIYFRREHVVSDMVQPERFKLSNVSLKDLVEAFQKIWDETPEEEKSIIFDEPVTVEERIIEITERIKSKKEGVAFRELFTRHTRMEIVVTFLAILELARRNEIALNQSEKFNDIIISERKMPNHGI